MQRAHSLVLEKRRTVAVDSGNLLGESLFYGGLLFSGQKRLAITRVVISHSGGELMDAMMYKCSCQLIFCQQDFLSTSKKLF